MNIEENVSLAKFSTLHVGGKARFFGRAKTQEELEELLNFAKEKNIKFHILGGGSNTLFRDEGFDGLIIKIELNKIEVKENLLIAEAGAVTRLAVLTAAKAGLSGMEHLAGIPGTIGGAVRGNAGSFGMETKDHLKEVEVLKKTETGWEKIIMPKEDCTFDYRDSVFKKSPDQIILRAVFELEKGNPEEIQKVISEDLEARKIKQPYEFPSAGSVFKNPPGFSAGKLIEEAGLKGFQIGNVQISEKHGNFIINKGGAMAKDILEIIKEIKEKVKSVSGVELEEEIKIL